MVVIMRSHKDLDPAIPKSAIKLEAKSSDSTVSSIVIFARVTRLRAYPPVSTIYQLSFHVIMIDSNSGRDR